MVEEILEQLIIFLKAIFFSISVFVILKAAFGLAEWVLGLWN